MRTFPILFTAEFKRFWTIGMIVFSIAIIAVGLIPSVVMVQSGMVTTLSKLIVSADSFLSFFTFLIFSAGIVGTDVTSGWLRTLLIRSITREQYVITKILVVFASTLIVYAVGILIAAIVLMSDPKLTFTVDLSLSAMIMLLKCCQALLLIILSTLVSCLVQGSFNSFFVYGWMMVGQLINFLVMRKYWDLKWAVVLKDYLFPNGFEDAQQALLSDMAFPYAELLWGCAALTIFFAATLFAMNRVIVDVGSE